MFICSSYQRDPIFPLRETSYRSPRESSGILPSRAPCVPLFCILPYPSLPSNRADPLTFVRYPLLCTQSIRAFGPHHVNSEAHHSHSLSHVPYSIQHSENSQVSSLRYLASMFCVLSYQRDPIFSLRETSYRYHRESFCILPSRAPCVPLFCILPYPSLRSTRADPLTFVRYPLLCTQSIRASEPHFVNLKAYPPHSPPHVPYSIQHSENS